MATDSKIVGDEGIASIQPQGTIRHGNLAPIIDFRVLNGTYYGDMTPLGHSPMEVSRAVINYIQGATVCPTNAQLVALERFHRTSLARLHDHDPDSDGVIEQFFRIFDDLIFRGALRHRVNWTFIHEHEVNPLKPTLGTCWGNRVDPGTWAGTVRADIKITRRLQVNLTERLVAYLGTLLHEMAHAIFCIYCCLCHDQCRWQVYFTEGPTHHGAVWQDMTQAIEDGVYELLGIRVDLGIWYSAD